MNNLRKYIAYLFDTRSFRYVDVLQPADNGSVSATASASVIGAGPALIVHGDYAPCWHRLRRAAHALAP